MADICGKARTELACAASWFVNWSDEQKSEFAAVLTSRFNGTAGEEQGTAGRGERGDLETLLEDLDKMSLSGKSCPSVFECQLNIFSKWCRGWSDAEKSGFVEQLTKLDPEFAASLQFSTMA